MPVLHPDRLLADRVQAIRDYHRAVGVPRAQIDVSGGIDSAVLVGLLARAVGAENVTAVHSGIHSNPEHLQRAREVCEVFGVSLAYIDLTELYEELTAAMRRALIDSGTRAASLDRALQEDPTILGSIRSTLRAPVGRGFNRMAGGGIRHGTGNECEDRWARFYQKGGDGEVDTNPIAMLSKGEVFQLALTQGVPRSIVSAMPSPDLWGAGDLHNDEDEFAAYFRFSAADHGQTFYSYLDLDSGAYARVGLIERVSRFLDLPESGGEAALFDEHVPIEPIVDAAVVCSAFRGVPPQLIGRVLRAARRIERLTRHKMNPNCPTLGERSELVQAGILSDTLPDL